MISSACFFLHLKLPVYCAICVSPFDTHSLLLTFTSCEFFLVYILKFSLIMHGAAEHFCLRMICHIFHTGRDKTVCLCLCLYINSSRTNSHTHTRAQHKHKRIVRPAHTHTRALIHTHTLAHIEQTATTTILT